NSGSQQNEDVLVKKYLSKFNNIEYIRTTERETIYQAWNRGIKIAKGKFICNSNTDDRLKEDALEILSNELEKNTEIGVVYADQYITTIPNQTFKEVRNSSIYYFPNYKYIHLLDRCIIGSQPMWRSSIHFTDNIWFNKDFEVCGDHDFYIRVAEKHDIKHLDKVLGTYYKSPEKSNKEYQDPIKTINEGFSITFYHTQKYLNSLSGTEIKKVFLSNIFLVSMPFIFYRVLYKIICIVFPRQHFQYPEYSYLLIILIYRKIKNYNKVVHYCKKYLKHTSSLRIQRVLNSIGIPEHDKKEILNLENV
ncbi:MAG TPA: glycosyltransferase, partial [Ignavibacteriaceae bacterium]|nr:glycosyltransferase [Ignavibacteriaceae bacterium]